MTLPPEVQLKIEQQRKAIYAAVKNNAPDIYRQVVEIGHIPLFVENKDTAALHVESAVMYLVAQALGLEKP